MAKISGIDIPELTFQEGSAPATPASTKWKVYAKTDGLYYMDDTGAEVGPLAASTAAAAFSGFLLTKSVAQTGLAASTYHAVTFDGEGFDTDTYHDNVTNPSRATVPSDGKYLVGAVGEWGSIADQKQVICRFYVNGAQTDGYFRRVSSGSGFNGLQMTQILDLTAGQYVEFRMYQADTTTRDISAGAIFWGHKIG